MMEQRRILQENRIHLFKNKETNASRIGSLLHELFLIVKFFISSDQKLWLRDFVAAVTNFDNYSITF